MNINKDFSPTDIEMYWCEKWEKHKLYSLRNHGDASKHSFSIQLPPPNVTGTLHMGHAFNQTIMDTLIRWNRMKQANTLWLPGTDHAGIATQMVVERQLAKNGVSKEKIGREKFLEKVWEWKKSSGGKITRQMKRLGSSCDWDIAYFTMDSVRSEVVKKVFVKLYNQGLIYRGKRLVNWDTSLMTAVSDLEVTTEDSKGFLWEIRYPLKEAQFVENESKYVDSLTVATTRPETLFGDVAVAVNPSDERYMALVGKIALLPIVGRELRIIADDSVDPAFGTGCVKITPAHDFNDYEVGQRQNLDSINIFTLDGRVNGNAPKKYQGLNRFKARESILEDLKKSGFLESEKPHNLVLKKGDRSGSIIEPLLTNQWFVNVHKQPLDKNLEKSRTLAELGLFALDSGQIKFFPENWESTYKNWLLEIQDWCISRQLWWGHQIPAWYPVDENGKAIKGSQFFVANDKSEAEKMAKKSGFVGDLVQEDDVLDTWFSSALIPFSSIVDENKIWDDSKDVPNIRAGFSPFLPSSVLVTGFDIIFFWVARMVMLTSHFCNSVPFRHIYIHALVRDSDGQKMSKSKGNTLDPIDIIDGIDLESLLNKRCSGLMNPDMSSKIVSKTSKEYPKGIQAFGADALRFTFTSLASPGRNINFDLSRCEGYKNFCNKLWNASRFVLMHCFEKDNGITKCAGDCGPDGELFFSIADRWILSRQHQLSERLDFLLGSYRFDLASKEIYEFIWNEYCDWYLEMSKVQLFSQRDNIKRATRRTMLKVLEFVLRASHPFIPFITEELWQKIAPLAGIKMNLSSNSVHSIMLSKYPIGDAKKVDLVAVEQVNFLKKLVSSIRTLRSEMGLSPSERPSVILIPSVDQSLNDICKIDFSRQEYLSDLFFETLKNLAKLQKVEVLNNTPEEILTCPTHFVEKVKVVLLVNIDKEKEKSRLLKKITEAKEEIFKCKAKLKKEDFLKKAPEVVVQREKDRLQKFSDHLKSIESQYKNLGA